MPRTMTVEQAYKMVSALYQQATGTASIAVVDTATFTAVANATWSLGYNRIVNALKEVLSGLIISEKPYEGQFREIWADAPTYGAHVLKISYLDNANAVTNPAWSLADGQTLGVHTVKLPKAYEANIYGQNTINAFVTLPRKQLRTAFESAEKMAQFFSGLMTNIRNQLNQQKEALCRSTLINYIGGKVAYAAAHTAEASNHVVHLLTEYNDKFGHNYSDIASVRNNPASYEQFVKYIFARMNDIVAQMAIRDNRYHVNPTADARNPGVIMRHSPVDALRCYVLREWLTEIDTQVMTGVWNREYLKMLAHESVEYWQSPEERGSVIVTASYMDNDGTVKTANGDGSGLSILNIFGVIFDRDALGVGVTDEFTGDTPMDVEKEAFNRYWKLDTRNYNDFTEKGVILCMD